MKIADSNEAPDLEKEFRRIQHNPIYFYELYW